MFDPAVVDEVVGALTAVCTTDPAAADRVVVTDLLGRIHRIRAVLDSAEIDLTLRADQLLDGGSGGVAVDDVLAGWTGTSTRTARKTVRRARTVADTPVFRSHMADGSVSVEHADVVAQVTAGLTEPIQARFMAHDASLAAAATSMPPEQFATHCRRLARTVSGDEGRSRLRRQQYDTSVSTRVDAESGMFHLHARFDPVLGAQVFGCLEAATRAVYYSNDPADFGEIDEARRTDWEHVRAHTLARMLANAAHRLAGHAAAPTGPRAEVVIVVDAQTLETGEHIDTTCRTSDGHDLPVAGARRLLCTALQHFAIVGAEGQVLALGTSRPTPNRGQRRALQAMYPTCAWPNCDVVFSRCEIHHIRYRRHGGPTDLDNLIPLCSRHHHHVHDRGWSIRLDPDRTIEVSHADHDQTFRQALAPPRGKPPGSVQPPEPPNDPPNDRRVHPDRSHPSPTPTEPVQGLLSWAHTRAGIAQIAGAACVA